MTTPFAPTALPSTSASVAPSRATAPSLAESMSALRPMEAETIPWHVRERWLVVLLSSFLPLTVGLVMEGTPRTMLLVTAGLLIAIGLVLLVVHELRSRK